MPRVVSLITDDETTLADLHASVRTDFDTHLYPDTPGLLITDRTSGSYAIVSVGDASGYNYERGELEALGLAHPRFFVVQFSSLSLLKHILRKLADRQGVWFDSHHDIVRSGPDVVHKINAEPAWSLGVPSLGD